MSKKSISFKKLFIISSAIVIVTMALLFFMFHKKTKHLNIYSENGDIIKSYDIDKKGTFSISFTHSVNKSPVVEFYRFDNNNNIYLFKTKYYNYGAGVPSDLKKNEKLTFGDDGSMLIENMNDKIDKLTYYLSTQSDHVMTIIGKQVYSLWHECGQNIKIEIKIEE